MKLEINKTTLPIKLHYFLFYNALGPVFPQLNVFGRQLGISAGVMGLVTAGLPLAWAVAKPLFGYVIDYWPNRRMQVFLMIIVIMTFSYCCLWFLPSPKVENPKLKRKFTPNDIVDMNCVDDKTDDEYIEKYKCYWNCSQDNTFKVYLPYSTLFSNIYIDGPVTRESCSLYFMHFYEEKKGQVVCKPKENCILKCIEVSSSDTSTEENEKEDFYSGSVFWSFVVLMSVGTVAFNVANCISDALCFNILGKGNVAKYGFQRVWGTVGYGMSALIGGALVDAVSKGKYKDFTPAFLMAIIFTAGDLYVCKSRLNLQPLFSPTDKGSALMTLLRQPSVLVFIFFAVVAGVFDSFIVFYTFWFLEDLAEETGHTKEVKLIEGTVIAGQCFVGELLFFFFAGHIIKLLGYILTLALSLVCYAIRMWLISSIQNPWHIVFIESIMQGPTYALCYACIVEYAAHVAPPGYSATVQGIVAGMDDGLGFAIGTAVGGQMYTLMGGRVAFRALGAIALMSAIATGLIYNFLFKGTKEDAADEKAGNEVDNDNNAEAGSSRMVRGDFVPEDATGRRARRVISCCSTGIECGCALELSMRMCVC